MLLSKCATCGSKKSRFIKKQAKRLLISLGLKTPLNKIRWSFVLNVIPLNIYKMNELVNKFLLAGDKFMPQMHLKQPGFTYSACEPFTKNRKRIQKFKKQEIQNVFVEMN